MVRRSHDKNDNNDNCACVQEVFGQNQGQKKPKQKKSRTGRDEDNYVSYLPTNSATEAGSVVCCSFTELVAGPKLRWGQSCTAV